MWWQAPPPPPPPPPPLVDTKVAAALATSVAVAAAAFFVSRKRSTGKSAGAKAAQPGQHAHNGVLLGSLMCFFSVSAAAVTFPFAMSRRDALGCDALCQGGQTTLRSGLTLVGATLIGRASDTFGRKIMLVVGLVGSLASLALNGGMDNITGMWLAIAPVALLNQNFSVTKALFADYMEETGGSKADLAGAVGKLGMAVGLSFMFGPLIATSLVSSYRQALMLSAAITLASGAFILALPTPGAHGANGAGSQTNGAAAGLREGKAGVGLMDFVQMPVLRTRGAQLLMAMRLLMAMAFHMWAPVWQVSIKNRFAFAPADHARFMGLVGFCYALSQGVVAKPLVKASGRDPSRLLLGCILLLGGSRPFALHTQDVRVVYALYVPMVIALGVMNTAITTAASSLADGDQLGGLFGVLESVESIAGMVGPTLGGLLSTSVWPHATLVAVCGCYGAAFLLVLFFFGSHVTVAAARRKSREE